MRAAGSGARRAGRRRVERRRGRRSQRQSSAGRARRASRSRPGSSGPPHGRSARARRRRSDGRRAESRSPRAARTARRRIRRRSGRRGSLAWPPSAGRCQTWIGWACCEAVTLPPAPQACDFPARSVIRFTEICIMPIVLRLQAFVESQLQGVGPPERPASDRERPGGRASRVGETAPARAERRHRV